MTTEEESQSELPISPRERAVTFWRAVLSMTIFGLVGGAVGFGIGYWGDRGKRIIGRVVFGSAGTIFGAFIAAFTSMKQTHREQREVAEQFQTKLDADAIGAAALAPVEAKTNAPSPAIEAASVEHHAPTPQAVQASL